MTDEDIKRMVTRFLGWKLPENFRPDAGISFTKLTGAQPGPSGTNLFDANQAEEMIRYMVDGIDAPDFAGIIKAAEDILKLAGVR